jgi:hypothetical protein
MAALLAGVALTLLQTSVACSVPRRTPNPSFPTTHAEARAELARLGSSPAELVRPLVVVAGIGDPAISSGAILRAVRPTVADASQSAVVEVSFFNEHTFDGARQRLLRDVASALRCTLDTLPEVDVVAFSMGGLVARSAAAVDEAGHRLPIRRLFTICTPHEGARLAGIPIGTPQSDDMRPTSDFIARLAAAPRSYELVCYARLDDITVGEEFAAPDGVPLWWVPTPDGEWAHLQAFSDERILADIVRRLRGEAPLGRTPAAPLPL